MNTSAILRMEAESQIVERAVADLLQAGCVLSVFDGEAFTVRRSRDQGEILPELFASDETVLHVRDAALRRLGWVRFIFGNDGPDVIADYTVRLEDLLSGAEALAEQLAGGRQ